MRRAVWNPFAGKSARIRHAFTNDVVARRLGGGKRDRCLLCSLMAAVLT